MDAEYEKTINNEFDYSNVVAKPMDIAKIVQYCDNIYNQFVMLLDEDEKRNEKLKYEFQSYNYKRCYGDGFTIYIKDKKYNSVSCKNYESFMKFIEEGKMKNLSSLEISLDLDFKRGMNDSLKSYDNSFNIVFRPYEISFIRTSNYNDESMNQIQNTINQLFSGFEVEDSIFC